MKRTLLLTFLLALIAMTGWAQEKKDSIYLTGTVADSFTKAAIPDVFVTLMRQDSTVIDTTHVYKSNGYTWGIGRGQEITGYYFSIDRKAAELILRFEHPDYETTYVPLSIKNPGKRRQYIESPKAYMKKSANAHHHEGGELDEVVVKATKVKMVWKGDTLVYNADAFNVPEGSMLDGLIKQLPGVELKDNGEIFVNGKKIDNLTLNGADFFKGKNKIMLENLPYFIVKNVEVYNKQTPENKYLGITDEDKKEYTMDVVLKREYSIGGSANLEAGYGTDSRYKLKGFGLRFSDHTRAVLFGGLNNINETTEYDSDNEEYRDRSNQAGHRHFRQLGGMFTYLGKENKVNNATEVNASWQDDKGETRQQSESYLTDGTTTYGSSASNNRSQPVRLGVRNTFTLNGPVHIYARANLDYNNHRYDSDGWSLSTADESRHDSINSSRYRSRSRSKNISGWGMGDVSYRLPSGDALQLSLNSNFSKQISPESESQNLYRYYKLGTSDNRDRRTNTPSYSYNYSARLTYRYTIKNWTLSPYYGIRSARSNNERREFLRDSIDYKLDADNSNENDNRSLRHTTGASISYGRELKNNSYITLYGALATNFERQRMSYDSQPLTTSLTRHYTMFEPYIYFYYSIDKYRKRLYSHYQVSHSTPSVTDLIDNPQTSDPLNTYLGNPDLKMSDTHYWNVEYTVRRDTIDQTLRQEVSANLTHNSIARGYLYIPETGARIYRPENIAGGNWNIGYYVSWSRAIDKKKLFHIGNDLSMRYTKSTSLALTTGSTSAELSHVGNILVQYKPSIRYQKNSLTLRLRGEVNYRNIHRNITVGNQPTDIWDFSYGLNGSYKLPWDLTIDTDLTVHSHRGYADAEMNDNRVYWDAALTKSLKQGRWVMKLRAYDLLGQVSNLRYSINAQGRTETWNNTLRRYAMLTVSYRFTQTPKKK